MSPLGKQENLEQDAATAPCRNVGDLGPHTGRSAQPPPLGATAAALRTPEAVERSAHHHGETTMLRGTDTCRLFLSIPLAMAAAMGGCSGASDPSLSEANEPLAAADAGNGEAASTAKSTIEGVPSYNQNGLGETSFSQMAASACGPTAATNIIAYWDQTNRGFPDLWKQDADLSPLPVDDECGDYTCSKGYQAIAHLYADMHTTTAGTTPYAWTAGMYKHVHKSSPACRTGAAYEVKMGLYQRSTQVSNAPELTTNRGGLSADELWKVIVTEIDQKRPLALYIDLRDTVPVIEDYEPGRVSPVSYTSAIVTSDLAQQYYLYNAYTFHWVTIYGYEGTAAGERIVDIKSGFGLNDHIRFDAYYTNAENLAIVTVSPSLRAQ